MISKQNFKDIFAHLRKQCKDVDLHLAEVKAFVEKATGFYATDYISEQTKQITETYYGNTVSVGEKIIELLTDIAEECADKTLDLKDAALSNALTTIQITKGGLSSETLTQIADAFRGNLPALNLLKETMEAQNIDTYFLNDYIVNVPEEIQIISENVTQAFLRCDKTTPNDIKWRCVNIAERLEKMCVILNVGLTPAEMQVVEDAEEVNFLAGFEE